MPLNVKFDRYAELTAGLVSVANESPLQLQVNGVALTTGWLTSGIWVACYNIVITTWTACFSSPSTLWTALFSNPSTTWVAR